MTLAQVVIQTIIERLFDHALLYILFSLIGVSIWDFYKNYWQINRNTDNVDLMELYTNYRLWSKYRD